MEFREQLSYPPVARVALVTLKGRNEEKVKFSAEHVRELLDRVKAGGPIEEKIKSEAETGTLFDTITFPMQSAVGTGTSAQKSPLRDLIIAGPAPAPLLRAETFYRYQLMLRTRAMSRLSRELAMVTAKLSLPDDVTLTVDIDPANLG